MADKMIGATRALLGQGLGMGWGDEAEAWLRSKAGEGDYEGNLKRINQEYAQYAKENPFVSGASEFVGGALPGVGMMLVPGGQAAGAAQLGRSTMGALGRLALTGAATGTVSGAGSATEGTRGLGAVTGGVLGGTLGAALPMGMRATGGAGRWLRDRLIPSEARAQSAATRKLAGALNEAGMTPPDIPRILAADRAQNIPSVLANTNPAVADLAKAVAQRTGRGTRRIEDTLIEQKLGTRERTQQQVTKGLKPGDYYDDLEQLQKEMRERAGPAYEQAYSYGEVTDPKVLKFMKLPQFQQAAGKAEELLAAEGRKLDMSRPTVETLDQVKRGLDALIEGQTDSVTGKVTSLGRVYTQKKNEFLGALDAAVPDYELARGIYKGGAELTDAMRKGINEFGRMDHEQVIKLVAGMGEGEKQAFRTGVARDLYDKIMKPSGNFNAAQRLIGSPEMQAKLQPLFDNPAQFELFKNSLEREAQLFGQSNRILGGSETAKNIFARESLDESGGLGEAVVQGAMGNWGNSLSNLAMTTLRKGQMNEKMTDKLAKMLMSKDPSEVAAVVRMLEEQAARAIPKATRASALEAGVVTGAVSAFPPAPMVEGATPNIDELSAEPVSTGPDIEADLRSLLESPAQ
jgi:hypothetical protein